MTLLRLLLILTTISLSGCFPYAWVTPPAKLEIAGGLSITEDGEFNSAFQGAAGVYPLQIFPDYFERNFDVGIGYSLLYTSPIDEQFVGKYFHGPYFDFIYFVPVEASIPVRAYFSAKGKVLINTPDIGFGGSAQAGIEIFDFADNDFDHCSGAGCNFGRAYGESSFGFFLEGSQFFYGDNQLTFFGLGLSLRSPATSGIGWAYF